MSKILDIKLKNILLGKFLEDWMSKKSDYDLQDYSDKERFCSDMCIISQHIAHTKNKVQVKTTIDSDGVKNLYIQIS